MWYFLLINKIHKRGRWKCIVNLTTQKGSRVKFMDEEIDNVLRLTNFQYWESANFIEVDLQSPNKTTPELFLLIFTHGSFRFESH